MSSKSRLPSESHHTATLLIDKRRKAIHADSRFKYVIPFIYYTSNTLRKVFKILNDQHSKKLFIYFLYAFNIVVT